MTVNRNPNHRPLRRTILAAGCALLLGACATWSEQVTPQPAAQRTLHGTVRITRGNGRSITLNEADVRGDSLVGLSTEFRHASIPLAQVKRLDRRRTDVVGTIAAAAVVVAAVFSVYAIAILSVVDD